MNINGHEIKLVIFDLDGTLIDSTSIWNDVDKTFFARRGCEVPETYGKEIAHIGLKAAAILTKEKYFRNEEIDDILNEWNQLSLEEYKNTIPLKNNAKELLNCLYKNEVKIALATANSEALYLPCLERLNIKDYFSFIIDVNSCKEGKNSSEIYDKVISYFGCTKEETAIFEDSYTAIKTAYLSGYNVVAVYDKCSTKNIEKTKNHSHLYIEDFSEVISLIK